MAYEILENNGVDITNLDGAVFNRLSTGGIQGVIAGFMNECQMYADGNKVILSTGCLLIGGIRIKIWENEVFTMQSSPTSNTNYWLVCEIQRLSADSHFTLNFNIVGTEPVVPDDDIINGTGTVRLVVGSFTHTTSGEVTNVKRLAKLLTAEALAGDGAPKLIWSGNLTLYSGTVEHIDEAAMYPELFQDPGLFALKLEVTPTIFEDIMPFVTTVLIDTEDGGRGSANFSGVAMGFTNHMGYHYGGKLVWGTISFRNASGYVKFHDGHWYDFDEMVFDEFITLNDIEYIDILSIHRISRTVID